MHEQNIQYENFFKKFKVEWDTGNFYKIKQIVVVLSGQILFKVVAI